MFGLIKKKKKESVIPNADLYDEQEVESIDYERWDDIDEYVPKQVQNACALNEEKIPKATFQETKREQADKERPYAFPPSTLLEKKNLNVDIKGDEYWKEKLSCAFKEYRINAEIVSVCQTNTIVTFAVQPQEGVRVNKLTSHQLEISAALGVKALFEIPLKGTSYIGIHINVDNVPDIGLRQIVESEQFINSKAKLPLLLGSDVAGNPVIEDLVEMRSLLVGGGTGRGKSVFLDSLILGLLFRKRPDELSLILIDASLAGFNRYKGIPHLSRPVVSGLPESINTLRQCDQEVRQRLERIYRAGCKDITEYNAKEKDKKMPYIVIVVDEFAPCSESEGVDVLVSLLTKGKTVGVYLILSTNMILSGNNAKVLKSYIPSRICFGVRSRSDSRSILDVNGAEQLTEYGEMLYKPLGKESIRLQGINVKDEETERVIDFLILNDSSRRLKFEEIEREMSSAGRIENEVGLDELFADAGRFVIEYNKASIGQLQQRYRIGFNRAAHIMDQLSDEGVVSISEGTKPRKVLMSIEQFECLLETLNIL